LSLAFSLAFYTQPTHALPEDADQPIHILGDKVVLEEKAETATYSGNVTINQGSLKITADRVTFEFEDEQVVRIIARGSPAYYSQKLKPGQQNMQANARTIVYHTSIERIDLKGSAHLQQQGNDFRGEVIEYDMRAGRVDATADGDTPIRAILQPSKRKSGIQNKSK
jgi:lipopolysaccharide export system protein LptA